MKSLKNPERPSKPTSKGLKQVNLSDDDFEDLFPGKKRKSKSGYAELAKEIIRGKALPDPAVKGQISWKAHLTDEGHSVVPIRKKGQKLQQDYDNHTPKGKLSFGDKTLLFMRIRSLFISLQERGLDLCAIEPVSPPDVFTVKVVNQQTGKEEILQVEG